MISISTPQAPGFGAIDPSAPGDRRGTNRYDGGTTNPTTVSDQAPADTAAHNGAISATGRASDTVAISPEAQATSQTTSVRGAADTTEAENQPRQENAATSTNPRGRDGEPLSDEEAKQVEELKARDAEVRRHEQAHVAAGGPYVTSGPSYEYQQGPDGKRYAVGGSVGIDTSPEDTPEATITKAQTIRRAALAPAEPSSQDRRVAAQASEMEQQARAELAAERTNKSRDQDDSETSDQSLSASIEINDPNVSATSQASQKLEQTYASVVLEPKFQAIA